MKTLRKATERGRTRLGWLDSWHSFSFGDYWDEDHVQFRALRVINDDRIAGGMGFGTHGHRDMEIVTWVLSGVLQHKDSLGNGDVLRPGDVQRMSAGTGILHSEFNPSANEPVHLLQIWIEPDRSGVPPTYEQKHIPLAERRDRWKRIVDRDGNDGALQMGADAAVYAATVSAGTSIRHELKSERHAWLQVGSGAVQVGDLRLDEGDGLAISGETSLALTAEREAELLLFDLR
jgi:quercetin 2,3-dioxygenase